MRTRSLAPVSVVLSALFFTGCASDISAPNAGSADASNAIRAGERLTGVAIDSAVPALSVGDSVTLRAALVFSRGGTLPGNGVRWVSLTSNVATVAATTGRVVTRAPGAVRVTATFLGKADTLTLTVNAPAAPARTTPQPVDGRPAPSAPVAAAGEPELPRSLVDTRLPAPTGRRLVVRAGDRLQTAIDSARPGDVLLLEAGATFRGPFRLRRKAGDAWITIRTSAPDASLPAPGTRVTPAHAAAMPKLVTYGSSPALYTESAAHHYRLVGLEIAAAPSMKYHGGLVRFGSTGLEQNTADEVPHHLILDRVYVHGQDGMHLKRCVTLNSAWTAVIESYLAKCHGKGQDTQAIAGWNGPGPFKIVNNHLEGAGENVIFGGADPSITGLIPSDIEFRGNYVVKPAQWKGVWSVKNSFELKAAQRVLVEGNVFDGSWSDGQLGFVFVLKSANQDGRCGWCATRNVTIRYNVLRNGGAGFAVSGGEAYRGGSVGRTSNILIAHNQLERMNVAGTPYRGAGRPFQFGTVDDLTIDHNTVDTPATTTLVMFGSPMGPRFRFTNNAAYRGRYGLHGLANYAREATVAGNAFVGTSGPTYGSRNVLVPTLAAAARVMAGDARPIGADVRALGATAQAASR